VKSNGIINNAVLNQNPDAGLKTFVFAKKAKFNHGADDNCNAPAKKNIFSPLCPKSAILSRKSR
jgi:hypothetical protein